MTVSRQSNNFDENTTAYMYISQEILVPNEYKLICEKFCEPMVLN